MSVDLQTQVEFGDRALAQILEAMPLVRFDLDRRPHLYAVTLHTSIVQLCGACLVLAKTEHTAGIAVLLRSMFEALVDLDNLVQDASYYERMDAANLVQVLKILRDSPKNPLLDGLSEKHDPIPLLAELDDLRARDRGEWGIEKRCEMAKRTHEYRSVYRIFCLDAHNNVAALLDRHLGGTEGNLEVMAFGDGNLAGVTSRVHFAVGWMLTSSEFVHGAFRTEARAVVDELQREHAALHPGLQKQRPRH